MGDAGRANGLPVAMHEGFLGGVYHVCTMATPYVSSRCPTCLFFFGSIFLFCSALKKHIFFLERSGVLSPSSTAFVLESSLFCTEDERIVSG